MLYKKLLDRCPHISTEGMDRQRWLEKRGEGIGGSEAGAIMGMSGFASPLTVYLQKKHLVPPSETSRAMRRGTSLEKYIREETAGVFPGLRIETVPFMLHDPDYPFMIANIDGVIFAEHPVEIRGQVVEGLAGHEIKSSGTYYGWGEDEIPDCHYAQAQQYMRVTGLPSFMVSVYILEDETLHHYVIRRNEAFITRLVAAEKDFWENYVAKNIMPAPLGIDNEDDMITGLFDGAMETISLGEAERCLCAEHVELKRIQKETEKRLKEIEVDIKSRLVQLTTGNAAERKVSAAAGTFSISWSRFETRRADSEALKKAGIFDQYSKVSESGRFTITAKKGA